MYYAAVIYALTTNIIAANLLTSKASNLSIVPSIASDVIGYGISRRGADSGILQIRSVV